MTSLLNPAIPGGAFDDFFPDRSAGQQGQGAVDPGRRPDAGALHRARCTALFDDAAWMTELFTWSQALPKPTAILIVSAHWESAPLSLTASAANTPLVYDFGGFHPRYFQMTYATPDASALSRRVAALMPSTEPVHEHRSRGLDHGSWVPLKVMYPYGDIPVLQLSMPSHDPSRLMDIGRRLAPLREEGVLIIGSGFLTHGLPFLTREMFEHNKVPGWSADFDSWAADALARGDVDTLASFRTSAPGMPYAHPTVEHFTPLFVTLGAATQADQPVHNVIDGFQMGLSQEVVPGRLTGQIAGSKNQIGHCQPGTIQGTVTGK